MEIKSDNEKIRNIILPACNTLWEIISNITKIPDGEIDKKKIGQYETIAGALITNYGDNLSSLTVNDEGEFYRAAYNLAEAANQNKSTNISLKNLELINTSLIWAATAYINWLCTTASESKLFKIAEKNYALVTTVISYLYTNNMPNMKTVEKIYLDSLIDYLKNNIQQLKEIAMWGLRQLAAVRKTSIVEHSENLIELFKKLLVAQANICITDKSCLNLKAGLQVFLTQIYKVSSKSTLQTVLGTLIKHVDDRNNIKLSGNEIFFNQMMREINDILEKKIDDLQVSKATTKKETIIVDAKLVLQDSDELRYEDGKIEILPAEIKAIKPYKKIKIEFRDCEIKPEFLRELLEILESRACYVILVLTGKTYKLDSLRALNKEFHCIKGLDISTNDKNPSAITCEDLLNSIIAFIDNFPELQLIKADNYVFKTQTYYTVINDLCSKLADNKTILSVSFITKDFLDYSDAILIANVFLSILGRNETITSLQFYHGPEWQESFSGAKKKAYEKINTILRNYLSRNKLKPAYELVSQALDLIDDNISDSSIIKGLKKLVLGTKSKKKAEQLKKFYKEKDFESLFSAEQLYAIAVELLKEYKDKEEFKPEEKQKKIIKLWLSAQEAFVSWLCKQASSLLDVNPGIYYLTALDYIPTYKKGNNIYNNHVDKIRDIYITSLISYLKQTSNSSIWQDGIEKLLNLNVNFSSYSKDLTELFKEVMVDLINACLDNGTYSLDFNKLTEMKDAINNSENIISLDYKIKLFFHYIDGANRQKSFHVPSNESILLSVVKAIHNIFEIKFSMANTTVSSSQAKIMQNPGLERGKIEEPSSSLSNWEELIETAVKSGIDLQELEQELGITVEISAETMMAVQSLAKRYEEGINATLSMDGNLQLH